MEKEIDIQLRIGKDFYEGKLHLQEPTTPKQTEQKPLPTNPTNQPVFPEPYAAMLAVSDRGAFWRISPTKWLGGDNFAAVAKIVREYGGTYVSAGKDSHFEIPK